MVQQRIKLSHSFLPVIKFCFWADIVSLLSHLLALCQNLKEHSWKLILSLNNAYFSTCIHSAAVYWTLMSVTTRHSTQFKMVVIFFMCVGHDSIIFYNPQHILLVFSFQKISVFTSCMSWDTVYTLRNCINPKNWKEFFVCCCSIFSLLLILFSFVVGHGNEWQWVNETRKEKIKPRIILNENRYPIFSHFIQPREN